MRVELQGRLTGNAPAFNTQWWRNHFRRVRRHTRTIPLFPGRHRSKRRAPGRGARPLFRRRAFAFVDEEENERDGQQPGGHPDRMQPPRTGGERAGDRAGGKRSDRAGVNRERPSLGRPCQGVDALFAPEHRTIDDALTSYEQTMLERMRGAIAEANADADRLIASTGPAPLLADYANRH